MYGGEVAPLDRRLVSYSEYRTYNENQAMNLPVPSPGAVVKFQTLYKSTFGVDLDSQQALDLATATMHLVALATAPCATSSTPVNPKKTS